MTGFEMGHVLGILLSRVLPMMHVHRTNLFSNGKYCIDYIVPKIALHQVPLTITKKVTKPMPYYSNIKCCIIFQTEVIKKVVNVVISIELHPQMMMSFLDAALKLEP